MLVLLECVSIGFLAMAKDSNKKLQTCWSIFGVLCCLAWWLASSNGSFPEREQLSSLVVNWRWYVWVNSREKELRKSNDQTHNSLTWRSTHGCHLLRSINVRHSALLFNFCGLREWGKLTTNLIELARIWAIDPCQQTNIGGIRKPTMFIWKFVCFYKVYDQLNSQSNWVYIPSR